MEVVASLSQGRTVAAQCGLFTHKSVPVIFEPPCICVYVYAQLSVKLIFRRVLTAMVVNLSACSFAQCFPTFSSTEDPIQ